jgi:chemotaxis protein methyltransferase CheR
MRVTPDVSQQARALVTARLGLHFPVDRHADFDRCFIEATREFRLRGPDVLLTRLESSPGIGAEWECLARLLTIGETYFFRDRACFEALERRVLPALIEARRPRGALRIWSAGCATGEEPYSLAILVDRLLPDRAQWDVTILGTDLNRSSLQAARAGLYRAWALRDVPPDVRDRHFAEAGPGFVLDPAIRRMVTFERANLAEGVPSNVLPASMDLILCRNMLIYFSASAARAAVAGLQAALARDGWLLVAPSEASAERFRPLVPVNFPGAIFFRGEAGAPAAPSVARKPAPATRTRPPSRVRARDASPPANPASAAPDARTLLAAARSAADRGDLSDAQDLCRAAIAADRLDPESHRLLAAIQQERGESSAALVSLRRALYLDPDSAEAHLGLGQLLVRQGERRRGMKHLETAARLAGRTDAP